jgi:hypothetical protein
MTVRLWSPVVHPRDPLAEAEAEIATLQRQLHFAQSRAFRELFSPMCAAFAAGMGVAYWFDLFEHARFACFGAGVGP